MSLESDMINKLFNCKSCDILVAVIRLVFYCAALSTSLYVAENYFWNSDYATISIFTLLAVIFELLWESVNYGSRYYWYVAVVFCMGVSGLFLFRESMYVHENAVNLKIINQRVEKVAAKLPGPVMATDKEGNIVAVSETLCSLTGYSRDEMVGQKVSLLFPEEDDGIRKKFSEKLYTLSDDGWLAEKLDNVVKLRLKSGITLSVTKYIFGIRYSVNEVIQNDIHFISILFLN